MQEKLCPKCGKIKPLFKFWKCKSRADGHSGHCTECRKAYAFKNKEHACMKSKEWRKEYGQEEYKHLCSIMNKLKFNGCAICGYNECSAALEFHHVNSEGKKFNITIGNLKFTDKRVTEELSKCILLCNRCHREIHYKEN